MLENLMSCVIIFILCYETLHPFTQKVNWNSLQLNKWWMAYYDIENRRLQDEKSQKWNPNKHLWDSNSINSFNLKWSGNLSPV